MVARFCSRLRRRCPITLILASLLLSLLTVGAARAQDACGVVEGLFQIDGQFYSTNGYMDWVQGPVGMAVFDNNGNPIVIPALYDRDEHWAGNAADPDHFNGGGNKNNDDISSDMEPWTWSPGSGPAKNDLTDVYAYGAMLNGDLWLFLGAATRANKGASHVDFEFNQQGFTQTGTTEGFVVGNGTDAGRTAGVDFIVSVDYESGGSQPLASFRKWQFTGGSYEYVGETPDPGEVYVCTNLETVPAPPWGAVSPNGSETNEVIPFQFVEIAVNLTGLGIDPSVFCTDVSTLLFKTRSSPSFTAELKDIALYPFSIIPTPDCTITADQNPLCEGGVTQLCAPAPPADADYSYEWNGPGAPYPDTRCITASASGTYSLMVTDNATGCASEICTLELVVNPLPVCGITYDTDTICVGGSAEFCGPEGLFGYQWEGPGGPYPDERCITVSTAGTYTLTVTDLASGCVGPSCEQSLAVHSLPLCEISGPVQVCETFEGELCGPEGEYRYQWSGPGEPYPEERCITVSQSGAYSLIITDLATGCSSAPGSHDLIVTENPECAIQGPASICPDGEEELCGPEGDYTYLWEGPGGPYPDERCVTVTEHGTYTLTLSDGNGCQTVCEHTLTLDENLAATALTDLWLCTGETAEFCVEATGTGPIGYQWYKDGLLLEGATESCYVIPSITASDIGGYCVEVTGKCGPLLTRCATLRLADTKVEAITNLYLCEGQEAELCATVSGRGPFTYQWTRNGEVIEGATDRCLLIEAVTEGDEGEYCVEVQGYCGDPVQKCTLMYVGDCLEFCGLTQGFYGNPGGKWNGLSTLQLLDQLIIDEDPLVIGVEGVRSLSYPEGTEACVIEHLPASGPPQILPENLGDAVVEGLTCQTTPKLRLRHDRLKNILLAQTITLSLNTRLDPNLESMPVCEFVIMIGVDPGPDGILGTEDDLPNNDDVRIERIPRAIFDALDRLGLPHTAGGVLDLANQVLADNLPGNMTVPPGDITAAAGAINQLVDECGLTIHCETEEATRDLPTEDTRDVFGSDVSPGDLGTTALGVEVQGPSFGLAPSTSPFRLGSSHIRFSLPEQSSVHLALYDVRGRVVANLENSTHAAGTHTLRLDRGSRVSAGIYFLRMSAKGLETGEHFLETRKIVVIP